MDYKKILKGIVDIINTTEKSDIGFANICSYMGEHCPELKESEDEKKIRKELIEYHRSMAKAMNGNRPYVHEAWIGKKIILINKHYYYGK